MYYPEPMPFLEGGVDTLLDTLAKNYDYPICGEVEFQGDIIEFGGINAYTNLIEVYPWHKNPKIIFVISKTGPFADKFSLCVTKGGIIDQLPGCILPEKYLKEVIYTISGRLS